MTPAAIAVCLALGSLVLAAAAGHVAMVVAVGMMRHRAWARLGARTRAGVLVLARLAPSVLAVLVVPLVQLAFWTFEPAAAVTEPVGLALPVVALAGAGLTGVALWRGAITLMATRRLVRAWRQSAEPRAVEGWRGPAWLVRTPFPVVAVVGVGRVELFVSCEVERECSSRELAAIAAHERAHVRGRDNLARLLVALTPAVGPAAARLERAWETTAEELADLQSRADGDGATLARALVKVARLAPVVAADARLVPVSTLIGAGSLEARVTRLLAVPGEPGRPVQGAALLGGLLVAAGTGLWGLPAIYGLAEWLVHLGR